MTRTVIAALLAAAAATTHADNPLGHDDEIYGKCIYKAATKYLKEQEGHSGLNREAMDAASAAYERCYQRMTEQARKERDQARQTSQEQAEPGEPATF